MFVVFRCRKCGRYLYADERMRTRVCAKCGFRNDLRKVRIIKRVEDERLAGEIVRKLQGEGTGFKSLINP